MVTLTQVEASNSRFATAIPAGVVAVFAGATAGIGEASLKEFAHSASKPRIYFIGRSQEAGDRLKRELKALNSGGEYIFIKSDTSLLKNVDKVCAEIKAKETAINVLFLSQGTMVLDTKTAEGLRYGLALSYYSRTRFIVDLLPLLRRATSLRRVVTVMAAGFEGKVFDDDWEGVKVAMGDVRPHLSGMLAMSLQHLANQAPEVSFIHNFPGSVNTNLIRSGEGFKLQVIKYVFKVVMLFNKPLPFPEVGHRHTFLCTSARFPPREPSGGEGVPLGNGVTLAQGADGKPGSGMYSVNWDGETSGPDVIKVIAQYSKDGLVDKLWRDTESVFRKVTGSVAA